MKKQFLQRLWFSPKENSNNVYMKTFKDNYILEVNFDNEKIIYWNKIKSGRATTQNFKDQENWVVLECVNRLLEKWYKAEDIELEKWFPAGHWVTKYLDILVKKDWKTFLMIECKTWWKEFEKELNNMNKSEKNQLFTYFQQDRDADYLILYASNENWDYKNEIVKIEDSYRETSNAKDFFDRWNKLTKQNWIFENWIIAYDFESRALTLNDLEDIKEEDASYIFNRFLEILRHNTVSDKPNAFNKMFTLFLCKIYDEWHKRPSDELDFQWVEWKDNHVKFQMKLTDLYKKWMKKLLEKEVTDFSNKEFEEEFWSLISDPEQKQKLLERIMELRLQKNNEFAIKEVFDKETFEENAIVLKEVVELLQNYKIRYSKKQPFLWDFFELLLTTWLKQEAGQFFTPVPIARFICKSIPIQKVIENKLEIWDSNDLLPTTIDYASWSGHFLTESMEEIQNILKKIPKDNLRPDVAKDIKSWDWNFDWAYDYMYWIEKDYRLVKTAKVWCFLHWDWIANVIHWDWLDSFEKSINYRWKLIEFNKNDKSQNEAFDLVLSNPPYSVSSFKWNLKKEQAEKDFKLFDSLTDNSSEIEALFIERTSQLLKEGWIAGIILPSSILSNTWIYTKAREIILKDFEIIVITELGSNTFMATWTNTVVLFLRKRNKFFAQNLENSIKKFFENKSDITLNWIENAVSKYVSEVWEWLTFEDYKTLLEKTPNEKIKNHEIFKDYANKIKAKDLIEEILKTEKEKLFYFVLTYPQKVVLVKSWEKKIEKEFLWYEFSQRKWSEWIHAMQRWKQIDECTKLFDPESSENPDKASTYIFDAFNNNFNRQISEELKNHIFRTNLSDLLTFDRTDFEKTISLNLKKKIKIESKWKIVKIWDLTKIEYWTRIIKKDSVWDNYPVYWWWWETFRTNTLNRDNCYVISRFWMSPNCMRFIKWDFFLNDSGLTLELNNNNNVLKSFLDNYLFLNQSFIYSCWRWVAQKNIDIEAFNTLPIPLPPKDIQQKIVDEIWKLEKIEEKSLEEIENGENEIKEIILNNLWKETSIWSIKEKLFAGWDLPKWSYIKWYKETKEFNIPIYSNSVERKGLYGFTNIEKVTEPCLTISARWTIWYTCERNESFYPIVRLLVLIPQKEKALIKYLKYSIETLDLKQFWATTPQLTVPQLSDFKIPLPSLEKQKEIVWEIEILERKIDKLKQENKSIPERKKEILEKYL